MRSAHVWVSRSDDHGRRFSIICRFGQCNWGFRFSYITLIPNRIFGILVNQNLFAVPLFVFMGSMLEKSKIAESLLKNMEVLFIKIPGGLGLAVLFVGMLLAASTGIVGATVVTLGVLSLPRCLNLVINHHLLAVLCVLPERLVK